MPPTHQPPPADAAKTTCWTACLVSHRPGRLPRVPLTPCLGQLDGSRQPALAPARSPRVAASAMVSGTPSHHPHPPDDFCFAPLDAPPFAGNMPGFLLSLATALQAAPQRMRLNGSPSCQAPGQPRLKCPGLSSNTVSPLTPKAPITDVIQMTHERESKGEQQGLGRLLASGLTAGWQGR